MDNLQHTNMILSCQVVFNFHWMKLHEVNEVNILLLTTFTLEAHCELVGIKLLKELFFQNPLRTP